MSEPVDVTEARRLLEQATPGPWRWDIDIKGPGWQAGNLVAGPDKPWWAPEGATLILGPYERESCSLEGTEADSALIVWLRNHADILLTAVEQRDRVLELHRSIVDEDKPAGDNLYCAECALAWPCPTTRLLTEGET